MPAADSSRSSASSSSNLSPISSPSMDISLSHYIPVVEQESSPRTPVAFSDSSPTSSYGPSSPSSMHSTTPSSVTSGAASDIPRSKTASAAIYVGQAQCLPGEDFAFATDPAYYEYLVKSSMADGSFGQGGHHNTTSAAQSTGLHFPLEL
jgi:hypothetical protein